MLKIPEKQHYNKEFFNLIAAIKRASAKNLEVVFFKKRTNHTVILKLLQEEGFIFSYSDYPSFDFLVIRLKSAPESSINFKSFNTVEATPRLSRKNFIVSFQELVSLQRREGAVTYYIIITDQGLLTSFAAIEKGIGGKLLFKVT